jgi:hypothetical protein
MTIRPHWFPVAGGIIAMWMASSAEGHLSDAALSDGPQVLPACGVAVAHRARIAKTDTAPITYLAFI